MRETPIQLRAKAFYNAGTTYLRNAELQQSKHSLQEALKLDPEDTSARYNLSYVIKLIAEQNKEKQSKEKTGGGKTPADANEEGANQGSEARNNEEEPDSKQGLQLQEQQQENMKQVLEALDLNERSVLDKMKRNYRTSGRANVEQDW
ncbi:hypothetical protein GCM10023188_36120 [Pontibacter saemangeumensis]|uniref:Tetratricopeptide repeat-containing protein n=2 Tax=Pontibacter saemangeumensis TaxID=1084525 RepID=A0ABP8LZS3_9BACT